MSTITTRAEIPIFAFTAQPEGLTIGEGKPFRDRWQLYSFMRDTGFKGLTCPAGSLGDTDELIESADNRAKMLDEFDKNCGLQPQRTEMHVIGQNVCLHSSRVLKFGSFVSDAFRTLSHRQIEALATQKLQKEIILAVQLGFHEMPGFFGGRFYAVAQAKWPAWPPYLILWAMGLLAEKWEPSLEFAADYGVILSPEVGHEENDLLTGEHFTIFCSLLSEKAKRGLGLQVDYSHFLNKAINPMPHFSHAMESVKYMTNHCKEGAVADLGDGKASALGGDIWSKSFGSFYTIGTVAPIPLLRKFGDLLCNSIVSQGKGALVYEAEDTGIKNPIQAMEVGFHNTKALRDGGDFIRLEGFVPRRQPISQTYRRSKGVLVYPGGSKKPLDAWDGGAFDAFAEGPVKAWELLGLQPDEKLAVQTRLKKFGQETASLAV